VDETTLALDVIDDVGPGGFFLGHQHTLDHFRELWDPTLASWEPRDIWEERGSKTMAERARDRVRKIRKEHSVPPLPDEVLAGMRAVIDRREATIEVEDD
jgi:trimethylamine--corrinoid protein Co-methyltransferase